MSKYFFIKINFFKALLFLIVSFGLFFGIFLPAKATYNFSNPCLNDVVPPGQKNALFVYQASGGVNPNVGTDFEPASGQEFCYLVNSGQSSVGLSNLLRNLNITDTSNIEVLEMKSMCLPTNLSEWDRAGAVNVASTNIKLDRDEPLNCGNISSRDFSRFAYEIRKDLGVFSPVERNFLFFIRFAEEKLEVSGCDTIKTPEKCGDLQNGPSCFWYDTEKKCISRTDTKICQDLRQNLCGEFPKKSGLYPGSRVCQYNTTTNKCYTPLQTELSSRYDLTKTGRFMPACAIDGTCTEIDDLLEVVINYAKSLLSLVGVTAFVFFVYGGFTMILSFGNPEKFKKGQQVLVAAVVGLIIVFSAYLLVDFLLDILGVSSDFRVI